MNLKNYVGRQQCQIILTKSTADENPAPAYHT